MRRFLKSFGIFLLESLFLILCAFIASLAFPGPLSDNGWGIISFFSLIPVFCLVNRARWTHLPFLGIVYGFFFFIFYNYWLSTFHPLAILIAPVLKSIQYIPLFIFLKLATSLFGKYSYIVQALFYVSYLFLTQQGFLGYPYGNLSSAVTSFTVFIQIADITGIWGICLIMTVSQSLAAKIITERKAGIYYTDILVVVSIYLAILIYGMFAFWHYDNLEPDRVVRIASIQHSADTWEGGDATYRRNFENLKNMSLEALEENPDIIAWSETAFVPSVTWNMAYPASNARSRLCEEFVDFGLSLPVPLVTGNPEGVIADESLPPYLPDGTWNWKKYNTVILFSDGEVKETYRKQHLVPFTEHFPYEEEFPWLYELLLANDYNWWEEGEEATVFEYDGIHFSTPICFEDTFGYLSADFVRNGADFLLNMTNDVWSGAVPAEVQHMQLALFRAIENRRPLLRSTNSGITCLITPDGQVVEPLEPFTQDWHIYEVPVYENAGLTFYTRFPDLFACLTLISSVIILAARLLFRRNKRDE